MIESFSGENSFLSNFCPSPVQVLRHVGQAGKVTVPTVEHGFVVMKAWCWARFKVQASKFNPIGLNGYLRLTPGQAKRLGRKIELRSDWEQVKEGVMLDLLRQKFAHGTKMADKLLVTGDEFLVEGNTWHDNFWGKCRCSRDWCIQQSKVNMLGRLLMQAREELRVKSAQIQVF